jgi:hypothetical protein
MPRLLILLRSNLCPPTSPHTHVVEKRGYRSSVVVVVAIVVSYVHVNETKIQSPDIHSLKRLWAGGVQCMPCSNLYEIPG